MSTVFRTLRRLAILLLCVPAVVIATAATAAAATPPSAYCNPAGKTLFHDNFTRRHDTAWTFYNRAGEVRAGHLWIDGDYLPGAESRDGWALTHAGDHQWRDYTVSVKYNSSNVGGSPTEVHMAMVLFRTQKTGMTGRDATYIALIWDPGQPDPRDNGVSVLKHGLVQLFKYVHGAVSDVAEATRSNTRVGVNHVTISAVGPTIRICANGQQVLSFVDPSPLRYGGVGVGQIWETNGWFDNVTVREA